MHIKLLAWLARKASEEVAQRGAQAAEEAAALKAVGKRMLDRREQLTAVCVRRMLGVAVRCDGMMEV